MHRSSIAMTSLIAATLLAPFAARAATEAPFTQAAFAAAQAQDKPILVEIDASWCPTCAVQRPILSRLMSDPAFKHALVIAAMILTGFDRSLETALVAASPAWLTDLTTRY